MASRLYGIVDTARDPRLYDRVLATPEHVCLFAGALKPPLERTSPYLVDLTAAKDFASDWRNEWGQSWGILCVSHADLAELRRHFRRFLQAKLPDGTVVLFRFYDPRVFRVYLPTCGVSQLETWFARVETYRVEAEGADQILLFGLGFDGLETQVISVT